jgi:type II secretion system protein C
MDGEGARIANLGLYGEADVNINPNLVSKQDIEAILKRNIFNHEGTIGDSEGKKDDDDSYPLTTLPIKLLGIIYGGTPYNGLASILNTDRKSINSFVVGDPLVEDARVFEIHRRRVIIERSESGLKESLELPVLEIVRSARDRNKKSASPARALSGRGASMAQGIPPDTYQEEGFMRKGSDINMSRSYKDHLLGPEFTNVLQDAKASPHVVDGKVRGFILSKVRENSVYQKSGLIDGDVIEEINGIPLNDAASAIRLLQSLRNESEIDITVKRGGSGFAMKLNVQ